VVPELLEARRRAEQGLPGLIDVATAVAPRGLAARVPRPRPGWPLLVPGALLLVLVLVIPFASLAGSAFSPGGVGQVGVGGGFTLEHFERLFTTSLYRRALVDSVIIGAGTAVLAVTLGYPVAYVLANTRSVKWVVILTALLLIPFQLTAAVRIFGLIALLGDNGLINRALVGEGVVGQPLPLMYNRFGVFVGTVEFMLPFVVFSLVGAMKAIDPQLMQAGRSLGSPYWRTFLRVVLPLSVPGVVAASLIAFTLTVSDFTVPNLLSAYSVQPLPSLLDQQVIVTADFRFAAALGVTLVLVSLFAVAVSYWMLRRIARAAQA
jgi:putative spermidine/putrescine transport system permease protein